MMQSGREFKTLLYIASDNRSGSTLLDHLLSNHKDITSVGELRHLQAYYAHNRLCTCGSPVRECKFWLKVEEELNLHGLSFVNLPTKIRMRRRQGISQVITIFLMFGSVRLLELSAKYMRSMRYRVDVAKNCWLIAEKISKVTGSSIVVDSSKIAEGFKLLYTLNPHRFKMIFLIRDGRGVTYSKVRRANISVRKAAISWALKNIESKVMQINIPSVNILNVKYENLCENTEQEMRRICHFIGVPFDCNVLKLDKSNKHNIGGSPHRLDKDLTEIVLDERWKEGFSRKELLEFNCVAGLVNKLFGYQMSAEDHGRRIVGEYQK